jgi:hypothetical protein
MFGPNRAAAALLLAAGFPCAAFAQSQADLDEIRKQIQEVRDAYEKRLQALEQRLKDAEAAAAAAQQAAQQAAAQQAPAAPAPSAAPQSATEAVGPGGQVTSNAFNPALSVVLQGTYGSFSQSPNSYAVTGFAGPGQISPGTRGFSLGESEVALSANIDHLFYGNLLVSFDNEQANVEEAYFQTLSLGHGLTVKGGRFFSGIGYWNAVHPHAWDFTDAALVQRTFLGDNYGDDGVQVTWIAPLPVFVEMGAEAGRGRMLPGSFEDGELATVDRNTNSPSAYTLFAHVGGDVGLSNSYRVGASYLQSSTGSQTFQLADFDSRLGVNTAYNGDVRWYGLDAVWKWAPNGNPVERNLKLVAEWMQLERKGDLASTGPAGALEDGFKLRQSGWYAQGVYQFLPQWRAGVRYDRLDPGSFSGGLNEQNVSLSSYNPWRWSAMADWNPSEFSRLRVQYNYDKSREDLIDHQIFLQYIYSLGVHGAHRF